jgi:hypothetical protein
MQKHFGFGLTHINTFLKTALESQVPILARTRDNDFWLIMYCYRSHLLTGGVM